MRIELTQHALVGRCSDPCHPPPSRFVGIGWRARAAGTLDSNSSQVSEPHTRLRGDRQGGDPAAATSRRNRVIEAGELVRNLTDGGEQRLFVETVLASADGIDWLKTALVPAPVRHADPGRDRGAGEQFRNRLRDALLFCPVSGHPLDPGRVFNFWGNEAVAKTVINWLLSDHPGDKLRAASQLETWHNPAAAYMAVAICHDRGITRLKFFGIQIGDLFLEVQRIAEVLRSNSAADDPESDELHRQIEHARQLLAERI